MKLTQNQFYGLKSDLPSFLKESSVYLCSDTKEMYIYIEGDIPFKLVEGEKDVITRDELEEAIANIPGGGGGDVIIVVSNYSALPNPTTVPGKFYYVNEAQGTKWMPGSLGGTYYPKGIYYSNGISWSYVESPYQATQNEANEGIVTDKFITPNTLINHSKWNLKVDFSYSEDNYVKYNGSIKNVNIGEYKLIAGQIEFDQTPTQLPGVASLKWNDLDGTLDLGLKGGNVTLQVGQETVIRVVNKTGVNLLESEYKCVRITGAQGQRLKVDLAIATNDMLSSETIGLVTENINVNQEGFVNTSGIIRNVNTTGSLQGETWVDGDTIYLSPNVFGGATNVKPIAPQHLVVIGYVISAHQTQGSIFVKVTNGYELDELHNVKINGVLNNQILVYDLSTGLWKNKNLSSIDPNSYTKIVVKDTELSSVVTGTTSETILKSYLIPANTFLTNDTINMASFKIEKTGVAGTAPIKVYFNTVDNLVGATQIALFNTTATQLFVRMQRSFLLKSGVLTSSGFNNSLISDLVGSSNPAGSTAFNPTISYYIITTVKLTSAADSVVQSEFVITN